MVQLQQRSLTLAEFLTLSETKPACEFMDGEVYQKPIPKGKHSQLQLKICTVINTVVEAPKVAYALPELRCSFGTRSIVPGVAVFRWNRLPLDADGEMSNDFCIPPDWMIEILSPEQSPIKVINNILYSFQFGTRLGWLIAPDDRSILVFWPGQEPVVLQGEDPLPILPEIPLSLTPNGVFGWLRFG